MNFQGLSLDSAPPISVPFRFFYTMPFMVMLASILLFFTSYVYLGSRYNPEIVAIVHLFTIGVFAFVMMGALSQMLPVIAGVKVSNSLGIARVSHSLLVVGLLSFVYGFYTDQVIYKSLALYSLSSGFAVLIFSYLKAILGVEFKTPTTKAIRVSLYISILALLLGAHLLNSNINLNISASHLILVDTHAFLAIFGFVFVLIVGVSYQVLPMFYVAPSFSKKFSKSYVLLFLFGLILYLGSSFSTSFSFEIIAKLYLSVLFYFYAYALYKKFKDRKRKINDVSVYYWYIAIASFFVGISLWFLNSFFELSFYIALVMGLGFIFSVVLAMLHKIIPFLMWFHLNSSGYMMIPMMNDYLSIKISKIVQITFVASVMLFLLFDIDYIFVKLGAVSLFISMLLLEINMILAIKKYINIRKKEPDFVMPKA